MISVDAELHNADWLRTRAWDLWTRDGKLVVTLSQLLEAMRIADKDSKEQKRAITALLGLPSATAMPEKLRAEIKGWLGRDEPFPAPTARISEHLAGKHDQKRRGGGLVGPPKGEA